MIRRLQFFVCFCFITTICKAQYKEKIETDRPDQTESPFIVPKRFFQAEIGFNKENFGEKNYRILHPTSLLKDGLHDRFELRLETNFYTEYLHLTPDPKTTTLLEPVEIGTKIRLWEEKGALPKTSFIAHVGLPFLASEQFHSDPAGYTFRFAMQNSLTEKIALGYNIGAEGGGGEETSLIYTLAPGFEIGEKWYAYVEVFGKIAKASSEHNLDAGFAYYLTNNTKLDFSGGIGLGDAEIKNYVAVGFSFRVPTKSSTSSRR